MASIFGDAFSQDKYGENPEECKIRLSEFIEYAKVKNYEYSYDAWVWCIENCPGSSKNIYKYGLKIAEDRYEKASGEQKKIESQLIDKTYELRIKYFPDNLGKVYSDWAISLENRQATKEQVFEKLEAGFKVDPSELSIKNLAKYFQEVTNRNKESNVQKVFDTYDDVLEGINLKIGKLTQELDALNAKEASGTTLTSKQQRDQKNNTINLRGLGQVETILDKIISEVATCERLMPLYDKNFEAHKTDGKWLRRAASRLNAKDCTEGELYPKIVEAFANAEPSPEAYIFLHKVLEDQGKTAQGNSNIMKAIELETDPYKKASYLYKIGTTYRRKSPSKAVTYAKKALSFQPSMGKAYLLMASAYAASANSCGSNEFSKRMVYAAAVYKARKAKSVDPSITTTANKYIKSYSASVPTKTQIFTEGLKSGDPYTIKCWIGETVRIP